ncbi:MAG TPA: SRPBCC family protein [Candidatus Binataceae bacterium]|nr:SRPBCC family protein [Candidatus Binataceae bacterium]
MMRVYYSTVFDHSADQVWRTIRDFNSYPEWVASVSESHIEDGKSGDAVGAVRNFVEYGARIRQRLLAHSDLERSYTYESCGPLGAIAYYRGTARVTPIVDGDRAFVEWSVSVECPDKERDNCTALLEKAMPQWMSSLRSVLERQTPEARA